MSFTHEHRAARIAATKEKYASFSAPQRLQALETAFRIARQCESQSDLGLIDWDKLSSLRGQNNATISGLVELMHEKDELGLSACQVWKTHHRFTWMFIDQPRFMTEAVHKQFLTILGDITKKTPVLKALAVKLSRHNWDPQVQDPAERAAQAASLRDIDDLASQLRANNLEKEVTTLWDYYAPPAPGKTPSYAWLIDYVPPAPVVAAAPLPPAAPVVEPPAVIASSVPTAHAEAQQAVAAGNSAVDDPFGDGPIYSDDELDVLSGM